jgi:putative transcriptional regulator
MFDGKRLAEIRLQLGLSQEAMGRLLGVSFATVNRWENRHSSPTGTMLEIYRALDKALRSGRTPGDILGNQSLDAGHRLHHIFQSAYGGDDER